MFTKERELIIHNCLHIDVVFHIKIRIFDITKCCAKLLHV